LLAPSFGYSTRYFASAIPVVAATCRRGYTHSTSGEELELYAFDEAYLKRLREGEPSTESHFVAYFSHLLHLKLRARYLSSEVVEDLRQETFTRVIRTLRSDGGIRQPDRLGAFVNSVCNHVLLEHYRSGSKSVALDPAHSEIPDKILNLENVAISHETSSHVRKVLAQLPERDQSILRAIFLEEQPKDDVCRDFGVTRDYLRVLVYRAKEKFRSLMVP
jgi:RNA polymerase sigma-70 factor (ECF subfamily)